MRCVTGGGGNSSHWGTPPQRPPRRARPSCVPGSAPSALPGGAGGEGAKVSLSPTAGRRQVGFGVLSGPGCCCCCRGALTQPPSDPVGKGLSSVKTLLPIPLAQPEMSARLSAKPRKMVMLPHLERNATPARHALSLSAGSTPVAAGASRGRPSLSRSPLFQNHSVHLFVSDSAPGESSCRPGRSPPLLGL